MTAPDHAAIVRHALKIAAQDVKAKSLRLMASYAHTPGARERYEIRASHLDDDICQLCVEMQRICNGESGPFPSEYGARCQLDDC